MAFIIWDPTIEYTRFITQSCLDLIGGTQTYWGGKISKSIISVEYDSWRFCVFHYESTVFNGWVSNEEYKKQFSCEGISFWFVRFWKKSQLYVNHSLMNCFFEVLLWSVGHVPFHRKVVFEYSIITRLCPVTFLGWENSLWPCQKNDINGIKPILYFLLFGK